MLTHVLAPADVHGAFLGMCFEPIAQNELRVGALRPTEHERAFGGDVPHWCHRKCFVELLKTDDYQVCVRIVGGSCERERERGRESYKLLS